VGLVVNCTTVLNGQSLALPPPVVACGSISPGSEMGLRGLASIVTGAFRKGGCEIDDELSRARHRRSARFVRARAAD